MWEVILGGTLVIVGTIIVQLIQNIYHQKQKEKSILFDLMNMLSDIIFMSKNIQKPPKSPQDILDKEQFKLDLLDLSLKMMNNTIQLRSLTHRKMGLLFFELLQNERFLDSDFILDLTDKYQLSHNKGLVKAYIKTIEKDQRNNSKPGTF